MTPELRQARAGKLTASKAGIIMGGLNTKGLADYVMQLAWERVYGVSDDPGYTSPAMERGTLLEADALAWDHAAQRFDNAAANALIRPSIRPGWEF